MEGKTETLVGFSGGMVEIAHAENGERLFIHLTAAAAKDLGARLIQNAALVVMAANMPENVKIEAPVRRELARKGF